VNVTAEVDPIASAHLTRGLTSELASRALRERGPNEIRRDAATSPLVVFGRQFASPVIGLLLVACAVAVALREVADAIAIGAIVVLNAFVGFFQEYRAERAVLALRSMTAPRARVVRDGRATNIPAREVVVGDVLLLEAGDVVAADAHVVESHALTTNEAPLTGESASVSKSVGPVATGLPLAERSDSVFMGTSVASGTGRAVVAATGMSTELGAIAHLLSTTIETQSPLAARLATVSRVLIRVCLGIVVLSAAVGVLRGVPLEEVLLGAISTAIAAVPEGLPAIVTIALAVGVQRMAARHVLVRKLPAVETLGCVTVICTDKTGTLTAGVMTVRELVSKDEDELLRVAASCCDAELADDEHGGVGDTTELAILIAAAARGIRRADIERDNPRVAVTPFDSERKRMSIRRADGVLYVKGAVEVVLARCESGVEGAMEANSEMAARGLRVLAVAVGTGEEEERLRLVGLFGIADPPRPAAVVAVSSARDAGIVTVMITGDHPVTARAIAREMDIVRDGDDVDTYVHARAKPEEKLAIVRAWKERGAIVAMTGDGVNDAPALREAHVGIAMGMTGTEVTREAADIVLADDDFASIVAAVREGRGIFDNIRKTLVFLLAGNAGELVVMVVAAIAGLPFPLLPLQLLWVNLVTDGLPALALVLDPVDEDALARPARDPEEPILGRAEWRTIAVTAILQGGVTLGVFVWALGSRDLVEARNLAFSTLVFGEVLRAFAARSPTRVFFEVGVFSNVRLLVVTVLTVVMQLAIHHSPAMQRLFRVGELSIEDCALAILLGLIPVTVLEVAKLVRRFARLSRTTNGVER